MMTRLSHYSRMNVGFEAHDTKISRHGKIFRFIFCYEILRSPLVAILVDDFYAKVADQSDKNTATRIVSPSVEFYASGSDLPVGFDDFFDYVSMFQRALAFKHVILETLVDNKTVLIYWRVEGTHKKELLGCALPTKQLSTQACRCSILTMIILFQKL